MQIHAHKRFDPLKVVRYHRGTCYPLYSPIEATFKCTVRKTKKWLQKKLYYRFNPIGLLTQNMTPWQMIAYTWVFNLTGEIFALGQLPSLKKTAKVNFAFKPITLQILFLESRGEMVIQLQIALNPYEF